MYAKMKEFGPVGGMRSAHPLDPSMYGEHMCISIPNMKFLCLISWLEEVCIDDANDDDSNDDDARWTKHDCIALFG